MAIKERKERYVIKRVIYGIKLETIQSLGPILLTVNDRRAQIDRRLSDITENNSYLQEYVVAGLRLAFY